MLREIRKWFMVVMMTVALASCRIFIMPMISVSDLSNPDVRVVPVSISTDSKTCDQPLLDRITGEFNFYQNIQPMGCFTDKENLKPFWRTTIPLLRKGDEAKIPYLSASIYYSQNNSVIVTFNTSFIDALKQRSLGRGTRLTEDVVITFQITNDTKKPVRMATQGVFIDNQPIGGDMNIVEIKPGGSVWIRLSNVGVNSLLMDGIEPVGVIPAHRSEP